MTEVSINKQARLSQHFTLGELCKTSAKTQDGRSAQGDALLAKNIPSHVHIENLRRLCGWLEELRRRWNNLYGEGNDPIIINSGFRSPEVNKAVGGAAGSNHLTGGAADIRVYGMEQAIRYACILLDISDIEQEDFDELIIEKKGNSLWIHFAVRPSGNRRKVVFLRA
jgi:uncharacterized protein YcbK (DUF882 family)